MPGMSSDDACLTVALDVLILSWFDLLLPCASHTHIHRDYWRAFRCESAREKAAVFWL